MSKHKHNEAFVKVSPEEKAAIEAMRAGQQSTDTPNVPPPAPADNDTPVDPVISNPTDDRQNMDDGTVSDEVTDDDLRAAHSILVSNGSAGAMRVANSIASELD